jgi:hypothetical protein
MRTSVEKNTRRGDGCWMHLWLLWATAESDEVAVAQLLRVEIEWG